MRFPLDFWPRHRFQPAPFGMRFLPHCWRLAWGRRRRRVRRRGGPTLQSALLLAESPSPPQTGGAAPAGQAEDGCLVRRRRCVGRGTGAADPAVAAGAPRELEALEVHPSALLCGQQLTPAASAPAGCLPLLRRGGPASGTSTLFLQSVGAGSQELRLLLLLRGSPVLFLQSTGLPTASAWHAGLSAQAAPFCGPLSPTAGAACCRSLAA